jgi:hypothetical protein
METCTGVRPPPAPDELLRREVREGREAVAQRALSCLMFGHEPRAWNAVDRPTARGARFLAGLDQLTFGTATAFDRLVDEFELPARHADEAAGWPDYAALTDERVLLVELKAEKGSHRPGQCERYLELARHHHPQRDADIVYVTPTMPRKPVTALGERCRYAHLLWSELVPLITAIWTDGTDDERALAAFLEEYLPSLDRPRARRAAPEQAATEDGSGQLVDAMDVARLVQVDRRQRGVELSLTTPEALESVRLELRDRCVGDPDVSNVRPWVWRRASSGQPLTELGRETGYELRLSYYRNP